MSHDLFELTWIRKRNPFATGDTHYSVVEDFNILNISQRM